MITDFLIDLIESGGIFLFCFGACFCRIFFQGFFDLPAFWGCRSHYFLKTQKSCIFRRTFKTDFIYDLEGIGCDGKILVIPDHNIEIITGGEKENIHSPCQFFIVFLEISRTVAIDLGRIYSVNFSLEIIGEDNLFIRHLWNIHLDFISLCKRTDGLKAQSAYQK